MNAPTYGKLALQGNRWLLSDIPPHVAIRMKDIFRRIPKTQTKVFDLPATDEMSADLSWFMKRYPLAMSDTDRDLLEGRRAKFDQDRANVEAILSPEWKSEQVRHGFRPGYAPYEMQQQAVELLHLTRRLLLGDDVGFGKTIVAMAALAGSQYLPAAIVVQAHLPQQWVDEFIKPFTYMTAHVIKGTEPYRLPPANLYIFRYTNIHGWADLAATGMFKAVVFDEIQDLRAGFEMEGRPGEGTRKGAAAKVFADNAELRLGLSATPVFNYGSEIWNIMQFIDPDVLGDWWEFVREWCHSKNGKWLVTDPDALGTYLREAKVFLRRIRQGRPINRIPIEVDFDEDVAADAEKLARSLAMKVIGGKFHEAGQAARELDAFARLQTGLAKAKSVATYVRMLIETSGEQVILAGWHRECFAAGTGILMADGTIKAVETVQIGDAVMGPDSKPRKVLSTVKGTGPLFRILPNRGDQWVCSQNHILVLRPSEGVDRTPVKMTAAAFAALPESRKRRLCLYRSEAVSFPCQPEAFEPWFLGYWLGDGVSRLADVRISTADQEVVEEVYDLAARYGVSVQKYLCKRGTTPCSFYSLTGSRGHRNEVRDRLRDLGLHRNKHIPQQYKTASIGDRQHLLAGLIDSDGYIHSGNAVGTAEFTNTNARLAEDVLFLARSLGLAATIASDTRVRGDAVEPSTAYRVTISGDLTQIPMRVKRKRAGVRAGQKNVLNTGFKIEQMDEGEFFGFETDGDHQFLLSDFTVVHNCYKIWLEELADFKPILYTGTESPQQKNRAKKAFINREANPLIISLRSGAGLDGLQRVCSTVVVGEFDWSPQVVEQLLGRVDRPGQTKDEVTAIFPYVNFGSDPTIMAVNAIKKDQARGINDPGMALPKVYTDESRIKLLAQQFLEKRSA